LSGTTRVDWYQKGKTSLDLLEEEIVTGSGISWAIWKSAPRPRQITTPAPHHSVAFSALTLLVGRQEGHLAKFSPYLDQILHLGS